MAQYTFRDIEEFLLDDDFFQWARYGFSDNGFDIKFYKIQHPGCEEKVLRQIWWYFFYCE